MKKQVNNGSVLLATYRQSEVTHASLWHVYGSQQKKRLDNGQTRFSSARQEAAKDKVAKAHGPGGAEDEEEDGSEDSTDEDDGDNGNEEEDSNSEDDENSVNEEEEGDLNDQVEEFDKDSKFDCGWTLYHGSADYMNQWDLLYNKMKVKLITRENQVFPRNRNLEISRSS